MVRAIPRLPSGHERANPQGWCASPFVTHAEQSCYAEPETSDWSKNSCAMRTCKPPPATRRSPSRTFGRDWRRSTARGNETGIHVPPPGALKFWGENHHEITVVAPTGFEPVFQ